MWFFFFRESKLFSSFCLASSLPIEEIVVWAHDVGAKVLVDACQSVPHIVVDVQKLNADFLVASSHKVGIATFLPEILNKLCGMLIVKK